MKLWDAFLEDFNQEVWDWSLRQTLEAFWNYCDDGNKGVSEWQKLNLSEMSVIKTDLCDKCDKLRILSVENLPKPPHISVNHPGNLVLVAGGHNPSANKADTVDT